MDSSVWQLCVRESVLLLTFSDRFLTRLNGRNLCHFLASITASATFV